MGPKQKTIKDIINCLCQLIDNDGSRSISPEIFRLAKFNDEKAAKSLKCILAELLVFLKTGVYGVKSFELVRKFKPEPMEKFIGSELESLLSPVCRPTLSSRSLLVNICWLISEKNVLEELVLSQSVRLGEDIACLGDWSTVCSKQFTTPVLIDPVSLLNALRWIYGLIITKLKILNSMSTQKGKLQHRIHEITKGGGFSRDRSHLSMLEVYLLRHPDRMKNMLHILEKDNSRLDLLVQFKEREHIFWKWIDSVLDAHEEGQSACEDIRLNLKSVDSKVKRTKAVHRKLQSLITSKEGEIDSLDKCIERVERSVDPCEKEACHTETESRLYRDLAKCSSDHRFLQTHYQGLLCLRQEADSPPHDKNKNYIRQTSPEKADPFEMYSDATDLIKMIEKKVQNLDVEISDIQCQYYDLMS